MHMYMFKHTNTWRQRSSESKRTNWVRKKDGMKSLESRVVRKGGGGYRRQNPDKRPRSAENGRNEKEVRMEMSL